MSAESPKIESQEERPRPEVTWEGDTMAVVSNGTATWKVDFGTNKEAWLHNGPVTETQYREALNRGDYRVAMQEGETAAERLELWEVVGALEEERKRLSGEAA